MRPMFLLLCVLTCVAAVNVRAQEATPANFHHVHLNVTDPDRSIAFYTKIFGAIETHYANTARALFTERSFILLNEVELPPATELKSGLWHIGWGGVDVPNEYEWFKSQGVSIHTPLYALGRGHVIYLEGPDQELIEVNTTGHHRFGHVHLFAEDVNVTTNWYARHLGFTPREAHVPKPDLSKVRAWSNAFTSDNVRFIVYGQPNYEPRPPWWPFEPLTAFEPTQGRAIDHIAFSYRDIRPVYERMKRDGVTIVEPVADRPEYNHKSFFVLAPDKVLVEIVEAKPIPEGIWE